MNYLHHALFLGYWVGVIKESGNGERNEKSVKETLYSLLTVSLIGCYITRWIQCQLGVSNNLPPNPRLSSSLLGWSGDGGWVLETVRRRDPWVCFRLVSRDDSRASTVVTLVSQVKLDGE